MRPLEHAKASSAEGKSIIYSPDKMTNPIITSANVGTLPGSPPRSLLSSSSEETPNNVLLKKNRTALCTKYSRR